MLSNRNLDSLILNSEWAIEESFARKEINLYLSYLDLIEKGVALSDLQLHNTKQQQKPYIIGSSGTSHDLRASNVDRKSIAIINLFGTMRVDGNWCSYGIRDTADWIEQSNANPKIGGILIVANSGGGEVAAGHMLLSAIRDTRKPIVVHAETLASAAVHGTLAATEIVAANDGSRIGSIGVFASISKKALKFYEENITDIYSSKSSQKNEEWRALLAGDPSLIVRDLDKTAEIFQSDVIKFRPEVAKSQEALAGKLFFAQEAKGIGLVNSVGSRKHALNRLRWHINQ